MVQFSINDSSGKMYIGVILILFMVNSAIGFFETCDETLIIQSDETIAINSPNFPETRYPKGSSCRWYAKTSPGYEIALSCSIHLDKPASTCSTDVFYVQKDGELTLSDSAFYCGFGNVSAISLFNELAIAYVSVTNEYSGYFSCLLKSQRQQCDCGWSVSQKIVGGVEASINEFIAMAGIASRLSNSIFCGGAIIHYRYIMSAAHCFINEIEPEQILVLVGDHDFTTSFETTYSQFYGVETIIMHEAYDTLTQDNDIALLRTTRDIQFKRGVGPACLPFRFSSGNFLENRYVTAVGWGAQVFGGSTTSRLRKANLDVFPNKQCDNLPYLNKDKFCTYSVGRDSCQGDSGGSLYYNSGRQYTVGIVSYGPACGTNRPSANTKIYPYLNWISGITNDGLCDK